MSDVLVGFVLDPFGYEGDFLCAAPVVRVSGLPQEQLAVGAIDGWFPPEARRLDERDLRFVVRIPDQAQRPIQVGETVWAIGSQAYQALMLDEVEQGVRNTIGGWPVSSRGYRWTIGTRNDFLHRSRAFANQVSRILKLRLRDDGSVQTVEIQRQLFARLEGIDPRERLPLLGLIARTSLDKVKYDLLAYEYSREVRSFLGIRRSFASAVRRLEQEIASSRTVVAAIRKREIGGRMTTLKASEFLVTAERYSLPISLIGDSRLIRPVEAVVPKNSDLLGPSRVFDVRPSSRALFAGRASDRRDSRAE